MTIYKTCPDQNANDKLQDNLGVATRKNNCEQKRGQLLLHCTLTASQWREFRGSARKPHQNGRQRYFPDLQIWPLSSGILSSRPFVRYKLLNVLACLSQYVSPPDTAGFSGISAEKGRYLIHRLAPRILNSNSTGILFRPNNSSENSHAINVQKWERGHYPDNVDIFPTIWPCSR